MLLDKLPLELVQHVLELVLQEKKLKDLTALLGVNKALEAETIRLFLRPLRDVKPGAAYWARLPFPIRRRMARDTIMSNPQPGFQRSIATYMQAVASYLLQYAEELDAENAGRLSHKQWLHEVISVLAPAEADCQCGKPAFLHSTCYSMSSVTDTAFHVVILKRYTKLEIAMIEGGKDAGSVCPYLKVCKKDPTFTRRNALEWACAHQLDDTVHRLVSAAEGKLQKPEEYLPTAAAICAATISPRGCSTSLLRFLLDHLFITSWTRHSPGPMFIYQSRRVSFKEWNRIVLANLAQHNIRNTNAAILTLRRYYPYLEFGSILKLLPENFCRREFGHIAIAQQRPLCEFLNSFDSLDFSTQEGDLMSFENFINTWGPDAEWVRHWHLMSCSADTCLRRYNKAHPLCGRCRRRHADDPGWRARYDWDGIPLSAGKVENVVGKRPQNISTRC